jgi:glutamine---fructose-6-phosphate transaminase (isomerizing)
MCGIFGYIGTRTDTPQMVLDGLKLLEYRGYDSWGIAVKQGKKIEIEKYVGKIGEAKVSLPPSVMGIGHTRWATHGGVTKENSHPHLDCNKEIAVIHNGIIENYSEIKKELISKGHRFVSETDTEVFSHLVEEYLKSKGFATAVRDAFNRISGMNAIVVAYSPSKEIIAAKTGSPLVIGKADDGFYLASDVSGIIKHTRNILFLKDNEMVILGNDIQLLSLPKGEQMEPIFETIDWIIEDADMGDYPHFMIKEIHDQAKMLRFIVENEGENIRQLSEVVKKARGTFFIAAGTAFNACLAGTYLFSKIAKTHVNTAPASEFNYLEDFLTEESLVIALSQSGETIDIVEPLDRAKEKGSIIAAMVNVLGSTIYRMANYKLLLNAGPEKAVASTKAYTAKLAMLLMLSYYMIDDGNEAKNQLLQAADEIDRLLQKDNIALIRQVVDKLADAKHIYVIGRGVSYATALEAALKIKEVTYIHTEGIAAGELKHGTIALIEKGTPCITFAPDDETYESMVSNAMEIKARGGYIIGVSSKNAEVFDHWIGVKDVKDASVITQIIPAQLISYYLALKLHLDPDKPRNLAKSVTVK